MTEHRFSQIDVFADRLTEGNPVAVVHDADDLTGETMAAFAAWTNLSETTFLLEPTDPTADYRLRIFTPDRELSFAGHPTLGAARAWLDAAEAPRDRDTLVQECAAGLVRIRRETGSGGRLAFAAPPLLRYGPVDDADVAILRRGLGLAATDIVDAAWVDNGPGWVALLLRDAATVLDIEPDRVVLTGFDVGVVGQHPAGLGRRHRGARLRPDRGYRRGPGDRQSPRWPRAVVDRHRSSVDGLHRDPGHLPGTTRSRARRAGRGRPVGGRCHHARGLRKGPSLNEAFLPHLTPRGHVESEPAHPRTGSVRELTVAPALMEPPLTRSASN